MPKHKTLIVFAVVIAFSFSLIGCGLLTSRSTGPDDVACFGDDLPEWLLLAHRSAEGPGTERDDDLLAVEDDDDDLVIADSDLPVGGSDQEDSVAAPSSNQGTQTAQAPQSSQPSSSQGSGTGSDSSSDSDEPAFGTKEHLVWLKEQREKAATVGEKEAAEADDDDDTPWFDQPSGGSFGGW